MFYLVIEIEEKDGIFIEDIEVNIIKWFINCEESLNGFIWVKYFIDLIKKIKFFIRFDIFIRNFLKLLVFLGIFFWNFKLDNSCFKFIKDFIDFIKLRIKKKKLLSSLVLTNNR